MVSLVLRAGGAIKGSSSSGLIALVVNSIVTLGGSSGLIALAYNSFVALGDLIALAHLMLSIILCANSLRLIL